MAGQLKTIAVATDLSGRGALAFRRALTIAEATGADILLVHAVDEDQPSDMIATATAQAADHMREQIEGSDVKALVESRVVVGDIYWAIHEAAAAADADLLIVGDHRRSVLRDIFRDTTVERLIRLTAIPVLLARLPEERAYRRALVGIESREAPELVKALDLLGNAGPRSMVGLHAFDAPATGFLANISVPPERIDAYRSEIANAATKDILATMDESLKQRMRLRIVDDEPARALQSAARDEDCDLIAISTHARRGLLRNLLGSVSSELIRHGTTDLLVVPRIA